MHQAGLFLLLLCTLSFAARVAGQVLQSILPQPWLPPFEAFQASNLPYWALPTLVCRFPERQDWRPRSPLPTVLTTSCSRRKAHSAPICSRMTPLIDPLIMFGGSGVLDANAVSRAPGLGVSVNFTP